MSDVETLFVINSKRGSYILEDMLAMIAWSARGSSYMTIVVDETGTISRLSAPGRLRIMHSDLPAHAPSGFHRAAGLKQVALNDLVFRRVIMLSDTCLLTTQSVDTFFADHIQKENIGLIGVRSQADNERVWQQSANALLQWKLPVHEWERPPISLCDDFLVLSPRFIEAMARQDLLLPAGCAEWTGSYGTYLSWVCHMLGLYCVSWGFEMKPLPPLYVCHAEGPYLPPPQLFSTQLLTFSPIDKIMGYAEMDIREIYKTHRGERGRDVAKHQPVVTGPEQRDVQPG